MNTLNIKHLEEYCQAHTKPMHPILKEMREWTLKNCDAPQMMVGNLEGKLLQLLVTLTGAWNVLEIGTFTGYSTLCMAEAVGPGSRITTIDVNQRTSEMAAEFVARAGFADRVRFIVGSAVEILPEMNERFDLVFIDADKTNYDNYFELVLPKVRRGGLILFDNMLWSGRVLNPQSPEDHALNNLNRKLTEDPRVENFLLPLRDGIQIVQKVARDESW